MAEMQNYNFVFNQLWIIYIYIKILGINIRCFRYNVKWIKVERWNYIIVRIIDLRGRIGSGCWCTKRKWNYIVKRGGNILAIIIIRSQKWWIEKVRR